MLTPLSIQETGRLRGKAGAMARFSANGMRVAQVGQDGAITVWDLAEGTPLGRLPCKGFTAALAVSSSGRIVARAVNGGGVELWASTGMLLLQDPALVDCSTLDFSPDESLVLVGSQGLSFLDAQGRRAEWRLGFDSSRSVRFRRDGAFLAEAFGGRNCTVSVRTSTGDLVWKASAPPVSAVEFSGDGRFLAGAGPAGVYAWDAATGTRLDVPDLGSASALAFSPDQPHLALAGPERITMVETQGFQVIGSVPVPGCLEVHLGPGGRLAGALASGEVILWQLESLAPVSDETPAAKVPREEWLRRGEAAWNASAFEEALRCFQAAVEARLLDPHAHLWLGLACYQLDRFAQARDAFERAVSLDPRMSDAWLNLGIVHVVEGNFEAAESCIQTLRPLDAEAAARLEATLRDCE